MVPLQPTAALLRNFDDDLAPGSSSSQRDERILDPVQPNKLLIRILGALDLALLDQRHNALPDLGNSLTLVNGIGAPVNADEGDVLEQDLVHGDLFDGAGSKADDEDAAVPGGALCGLVDEADGVVDDVDAAGLWRQGLYLGGPVGVGVGDCVVGAVGAGDFELAGGGGGGDDGGAEGFGDLRGCELVDGDGDGGCGGDVSV